LAASRKEVYTMTTVASFIVSTLDGFYAGPELEFDWPRVDEEFNQFSIGQLDAADALLFGRLTYQFLASYWPTDQAAANDPQVTTRMNSMRKVVFSQTLSAADWENSRVARGNVADEIGRLREGSRRDLLVLGSPSLTAALAEEGLLDELRIMINPILLGQGRSLLESLQRRVELHLLSAQPFSSGNVLLNYQPIR